MTSPAIPPFDAKRAQPLANMVADLNAKLAAIDLDDLALKPPPPSVDDEQAAKIALRLLAGHEGNILLEWLADKTVRRPSVLPPIGTDAMQQLLHMQRREGQNDVLYLLMALIERGREGTVTTREGSAL